MSSDAHPGPIHIFLSFAAQDRTFRNELMKHLVSLQRSGVIEGWDEDELPPGSDWQEVVNERFEQADLILISISPDYIHSGYCYGVQMKRALEKHDAGEARVIPLHVRPAFWQGLPIAKLQGLPMSDREGIKPVSKWKNKDEAYVRIVKGIKNVVEELTPRSSHKAISHTGEHARLWHVPYRRNPFFTARDEILLALHQAFAQDRNNTIHTQVVSGLGGIGKTQLALEYAYRYSADYQAVFWLKGDSAQDLLSDYLTLARLLKLPERKESDSEIVVAAIKRALQQVARWLLIIDNLDNFDLFDDLIPLHGDGDILITSQSQASGGMAVLSTVATLAPEEGALLLLRRAKLVGPDGNLDALPSTSAEKAREISALVGGLPLALDQAGAYIEETKIGLPRYSELYQKHTAKLLKQRGKFASNHHESVATTFALALEKVRQRNAVAAELLSFCAFLHPDAIPIELFDRAAPDLGTLLQAVVTDELELNAAFAMLLNFSLIQRNSENETISLHRLVQVVLKDEVDEPAQRLWSERVGKALARVFPEPEFEMWTKCEQYLPHVLVVAGLIKQWDLAFKEAAQVLRRAGSYLYVWGRYSDARLLCEQALTIAERDPACERAEMAQILHSLGEIYRGQDDYAQSLHSYQRALDLAEQVWGPQNPETATILNHLGELLQTQEQFAQAEDYYRRALAIREQVLGPDDEDTAASLNNLAGIRDAQGDYTQARPLYEQALELREHSLGPYHPDTAESLSNISRFYRLLGRYRQAGPYYERATAAYEHIFGPEHPRVATCLNNHAVLCIALAHYEQAEQLLTRALEIRLQLLGEQHPLTGGAWNNLARTYSKQRRYDEAKTLYERVLSIYEREYGRHHSSTALILTNMGELYLEQRDYTSATTFLTEALTIYREKLGSDHPNTAHVFNLLGRLSLEQHNDEQAAQYLTEALLIRQEKLGKTHPETAMTLKNLADLAVTQNDDQQAERLYQQALQIALDPLGEDHPDIVELRTRYADLLRKHGREDEIQALFQHKPSL